jgi:hypothetical protein
VAPLVAPVLDHFIGFGSLAHWWVPSTADIAPGQPRGKAAAEGVPAVSVAPNQAAVPVEVFALTPSGGLS